jgi:hypothetical protein
MKKSLILFSTLLLSISGLHAQQGSYSDPAQAYLRLLLEKGTGETDAQYVGNFKVRGTSYLYGGNLWGNAYFGNGSAKNIQITYDTYKQVLALNSGDASKSMVKQLNDLDSFSLTASDKTDFQTDLHFINASLVDSSKKMFLQVIYSGPRYSLYKAYKSELGYVSTNYVQSELRQFDLKYDYYYSDSQKPGLKKLRTTSNAVKKEFKSITDVSPFVDEEGFSSNPEKALVKVFSAINYAAK